MKTLQNKLVRDESGAIMIIGTFMALGLIGTLWFLLGMGSSIVAREKSQQAADAVAFSAAAVHARDMNFIVAINLVMFMLAALWLLLCITYTVMQIVAIYTWLVGIVSCIVGCEGLPAAGETEEIKEDIGQIKDEYQSALDTALPALSLVQTIVQGAADPEAIALTAVEVARHDDGNIMGGAGSVDIVTEAALSQQIGGRLGMPIENEKNSTLCNHAANWAMAYVQSLLQKNPIVQQLMNLTWTEKLALKLAFSEYISSSPFAGMTFDKFEDLLSDVRKYSADALTDFYCSGGVWDKAGPKRMSRPNSNKPSVMEKNASDYMQVYGVTMPASGTLDDNDAEHKIGIASRTQQVHTDPTINFNYAQAEYFFDCAGKWDSADCNAINEIKDTGIDAAMYRMEWRARLVRVHTPKNLPASQVINAVGDLLRAPATMKRLDDSGPLASTYRDAFSKIPSNILGFLNDLPAANFH